MRDSSLMVPLRGSATISRPRRGMLHRAAAVFWLATTLPVSAHELHSARLHIHKDAVEDEMVVLGARVGLSPRLLITETIHSELPSMAEATAGVTVQDADGSRVDYVETERAGAMRAGPPR